MAMRNLVFLLLLPLRLFAQEPLPAAYAPGAERLVVGFGGGLPYGGLGVQMQWRPSRVIGLFAGFGYAIVGTAGGGGVVLRLSPDTRFCPFLTGMYGYNGIIDIRPSHKYNGVYYGTSFGVGGEFHGRNRSRFFSVQVLLPQRSQEFQDASAALRRNPNVVIDNDPWPLVVALGYHFGM
jgi:hypothetical protein